MKHISVLKVSLCFPNRMKRLFQLSSLLFLLIWISSCRKDFIITDDPSAKLSFSKDTVMFDTVFTTVGSVTKRFTIYNRNKNAVKISSISLVQETNEAKYRLNVDGISGNLIKDVELPGNDSVFVFVEVTMKADGRDLPFFVNNEIVFQTNGNTQKVQVVSYGQNAHFYTDSVLAGNITWTNDLPYVIYGGILVDTLSTLTIQPGVRVYLHKDAQIYVIGTLQVNGTLQDSVTFRGDRLEQEYYNEPGQWNSIQFLPGSINNKINYATIKGSVFGVIVGTLPLYGLQPELEISNSVISYSNVTGIFGIAGKIKAYNNLIFASGQYGFFTQYGGDYELIHNTIAQTNNFTNRQTPAVALTDYIKQGNATYTNPLSYTLQNNIIWGYLKEEFIVDAKSATPPAALVEYNLIRTSLTSLSSTNTLNKDPLFIDPSISLNDLYTENYHLKPNSPAKAKGTYLSSPALLLRDKDGENRPNPPSIGCFEGF